MQEPPVWSMVKFFVSPGMIVRRPADPVVCLAIVIGALMMM